MKPDTIFNIPIEVRDDVPPGMIYFVPHAATFNLYPIGRVRGKSAHYQQREARRRNIARLKNGSGTIINLECGGFSSRREGELKEAP